MYKRKQKPFQKASVNAPADRVESQQRDLIFISHANPEDNDIALWLRTHLSREGYRVWCDLPQLLGGERFWSEIENTIRHKAVKVLYVLSKVSNMDSDRGFRKELHLADSEAKRHAANGQNDFLIPLAVDDLNPNDYNVYVQQRNAMRFQNGWASGFVKLLKKLKRDRVPRGPSRQASRALADWWRNYRSATAGVQHKPAQFLSNWLPIQRLPEQVLLHKIAEGTGDKVPCCDFDLLRPTAQQGDFLLSFADIPEISDGLPPTVSITTTERLAVKDIVDGRVQSEHLDSKTLKNVFITLLRAAWERWIATRAVGIYELANSRQCAYFLKPENGDAKGHFVGVDDSRTWRNLTGIWSRKSKKTGVIRKRYWHFGVDGYPKLYPFMVYHVTPHAIFSSDGKQVWSDKGRMHRARRSQCKDWYNEEWRDRLLAALGNLSDELPEISLPVAADAEIVVGTTPLSFESRISFEVLVQKIRPRALAAVAKAFGTDSSVALEEETRDSAVVLHDDDEEDETEEYEVEEDEDDEFTDPEALGSE